MATIIKQPTVIQAEGNIPKKIEEFVGRVNSQNREISIARMTSAKGWTEPGQSPEFTEYTLVLKGALQVKTNAETHVIRAGQAIIINAGEWVQYSTPQSETEYVAVCLPAFSPNTVHRDS